MNIPEIVINGKTYRAQDPKARAWRRIMEFDEKRKELENKEYIDAHAKVIAEIFDVPEDDILDNLNISDILQVYFECHTYMFKLLTSKLKILDRSEGGGETK